MALRHLDLFSGIGGFALAMRWLGHETVGFCEIDPWCRKVLDKHWPEVPKHDDIKTLKGTDFGAIDIITGGFPCQPFSVAGKQRGRDDDRHLWPEMLRVISEARPRFILGENVAGIVKMELDSIWSDLETLGYSVGAVTIPAGAVNALHRRERLWIMAYRDGDGSPDGGQRSDTPQEGISGGDDPRRGNGNAGEISYGGPRSYSGSEAMANPDCQRVEGGESGTDRQHQGSQGVDQVGHSGSPRPGDEAMADANKSGLERHGSVHAATGEAQAAALGGGGPLPDTQRERQPRPWAREHASDSTPHREGQAGDAVHDGSTTEGGEDARSVGSGPDGVSPRLVRSGWADGTWELDLPRVVTHEQERKQKLMAAGNAIVPQVAYEVLLAMIGEAE